MSGKPTVGFIGVGLMGWGMAKNAVEKGFPLRVVAHRKREAVDDLVGRGAVECADIAELAAASDIIALCVTGSPQVEAACEIIAAHARPGTMVIESSTAEPDSTRRLAAMLAEKSITLLDAPLSRTPAHAWDGELTTYVGGESADIAKVRPVLESWATVIIETGPVGSAHTMKLINNAVGIGYSMLWGECYAMVERAGLDVKVFHEIVTNSGLNCGNFQNYSKYLTEGDPNAHKFTQDNMLKDITYYNRLATAHNAATLMSDGVMQGLKAGVNAGLGGRYMTQTVDIFRRLNGAPVD